MAGRSGRGAVDVMSAEYREDLRCEIIQLGPVTTSESYLEWDTEYIWLRTLGEVGSKRQIS